MAPSTEERAAEAKFNEDGNTAREILQWALWQWSLCCLELCYEMRLSQIHLNIYVLLSLQHSLLESLKLHSGFSDWVF
ncbi:uncharacterized protein LOC110930122 isoform X2 [Helianthus annuus]|uniref:uncharacterized protein LOC110930122 isoform X2 n=1 Tax=Helianthus annuus TaxID=4232 RepID=UPI001652DCAC|nr:uncharacterized protein LOC110930122 isoform X2 [Helianthus annuus]